MVGLLIHYSRSAIAGPKSSRTRAAILLFPATRGSRFSIASIAAMSLLRLDVAAISALMPKEKQ
jgi:hypothetical protein